MSQDYSSRGSVSRIDASISVPVRTFIFSSLLWLLVASVLSLIVALKLQVPSFLGECPWFTYGRIETLQRNAFIYGWASNALFALNLWIMSSLARFELKSSWLPVLGGIVWNLTLTYGLIQVLLGQLNGFALLEMPKEVAPAMVVAFLFAALWPAVAFARRPTGNVFVSQWYIIGATFVFPVIMVIAQLMLLWCPTLGVMQALVHSWFYQNLILLWLGGSALSAVYYFVAKESGRTISAYYLATVGFWTLFLFASWTGPATLLGGPIPVWLQSVGVVAALLMLVPTVITAVNIFGTLAPRNGIAQAWNNTTLRFVLVGAISFTLSALLNIVFSTRSLNALVRFTPFGQAQEHLAIYSFVSMVIFGAAYYILPRLTGSFWPSAKLVHLHFWSCAAGSLLFVVAGLTQGWAAHGRTDFAVSALPGLLAASLLLVGHFAFALNALGMLAADKAPSNRRSY